MTTTGKKLIKYFLRVFFYFHTAIQYKIFLKTIAIEWKLINQLNAKVLNNKRITIMDNKEFIRLHLLKHITVEYYHI